MSQSSIRLGGRVVAAGADPFVIAEIGVNHDGSIDRARELVLALACGPERLDERLQLLRAAHQSPLLHILERPAARRLARRLADAHEQARLV